MRILGKLNPTIPFLTLAHILSVYPAAQATVQCSEILSTHSVAPPAPAAPPKRTVDDALNAARQKNYHGASEILRELHEQNPNNKFILGLLGHNLFMLAKKTSDQKKIAEAIWYLSEAIKMNNDFSQNYYDLAEAHIKTGDYQSALDVIQLFFAKHPSLRDSYIYSLQSRALFNLKRLPEAIEAINQELEFSPNNLIALGFKMKLLNKLQRFQEALAVADQSLEIDPKDIKTLFMKAQAQLGLREFADAYATVETGLRIEPNNYYLLGIKARSLMGQDKLEDALNTIEIAINKMPNDIYNLSTKATILLYLGELPKGLSVAEQLIKQFPLGYAAHRIKAKILIAMGRYHEAVKTLDAILLINPRNPPTDHLKAVTYVVRAEALLRLGRYEEALWNSDMALGFERNLKAAIKIKLRAAMALERYADALDLVDELSKLIPRGQSPLGMRTQILILSRRIDEAEAVVNQMDDGFYRQFFRAQILIAKANESSTREAIGILTKLEQDPAVLWILAHAHYQAGTSKDLTQARKLLNDLVKQEGQSIDLHALAAITIIDGKLYASTPADTRKWLSELSVADLAQFNKIKESVFRSYNPKMDEVTHLRDEIYSRDETGRIFEDLTYDPAAE